MEGGERLTRAPYGVSQRQNRPDGTDTAEDRRQQTNDGSKPANFAVLSMNPDL